MSQEGLYMLAIMPPPDLTKEIGAIRYEFSQRYHCKEALKPPVHITLIPPFKAAKEEIEKIIEPAQDFTRMQIPFPLTLKNYDIFRGNAVIFIKVIHDDLLVLFQKDLQTNMLKWVPGIELKSFKEYHPHITIGYRDIPPDLFDAAAFAFSRREFFATFIVNAIHIWKHNGTHWEVFETLNMGTMGVYA